MSLSTPEIVFLDFKNYLALNYSLALFLKHYVATEDKCSFPYENVQGIEDLKWLGLPEKQIFSSSLKNKMVSDDGYAADKNAWEVN